MDNYLTFPTISSNLIKALEERFPSKDYDPSYNPREIDYYCGARSVVRFLKEVYVEQNENILNTPTN